MAEILLTVRRTWHFPLLAIYYFLARPKGPIERDVHAFLVSGKGAPERIGTREVLDALTTREFRSVFYTRLRAEGGLQAVISIFLRGVYPGQIALAISAEHIGPGLVIMHGFATIVVARSIGSDCMIAQQVTIGFKDPNRSAPIIGDRVSVLAGAKVLGEIEVGHDAVIGAGAVVVGDVPAYAVMVGVPARVLRYNQPQQPD